MSFRRFCAAIPARLAGRRMRGSVLRAQPYRLAARPTGVRRRGRSLHFQALRARSRTSIRTLSGIGLRLCGVSASIHTHSS